MKGTNRRQGFRGIVYVSLSTAVPQQFQSHAREIYTDYGERVTVTRVSRVGQHVCGHAGILLSKVNEILQSQDTHPAKVRLGIVPLEADLLPLLGHPRIQGLVRHQQAPQLQQLLLVLRIIRAVRRLPELLALHAELTVAPDQLHALAERLGKVWMRHGIDLLGHQHGPDGILENLALRFRRYAAMVGVVVQVSHESPDARVARSPEVLLDGEGARRAGRLAVADPL